MKISDLEKYEYVYNILNAVDLPPEFIKQFEEWCSKQPPIELKMVGLKAAVYNSNPFIKMVKK